MRLQASFRLAASRLGTPLTGMREAEEPAILLLPTM
jgi:hypothetical protein